MAERSDRSDVRRRAPDHAPRLVADRVHLAGPLVDRDDGRLEQHDPLVALEDNRVRRAEIDCELTLWAERAKPHPATVAVA
jgi:hypothetical protein